MLIFTFIEKKRYKTKSHWKTVSDSRVFKAKLLFLFLYKCVIELKDLCISLIMLIVLDK